MCSRKLAKGSRQTFRSKHQLRGVSPPKGEEHSKEELEKDKLMKKLSVMKFSSIDYLEAKFPEVCRKNEAVIQSHHASKQL